MSRDTDLMNVAVNTIMPDFGKSRNPFPQQSTTMLSQSAKKDPFP